MSEGASKCQAMQWSPPPPLQSWKTPAQLLDVWAHPKTNLYTQPQFLSALIFVHVFSSSPSFLLLQTLPLLSWRLVSSFLTTSCLPIMTNISLVFLLHTVSRLTKKCKKHNFCRKCIGRLSYKSYMA